MAKAILVMDRPDYCNDCYARHMSQSGSFCRAAKEYLQPKAKRPDWCPLLELPEKVAVAMTKNEVIKICNTIIFAASMSLSNPQETPLNMTKEELVEAMGMAIKAIKEVQQYRTIGTQEECRTAMEKQNWIAVTEQMPKEHDSMFAKYKGTDKWDRFMFEKISHDVLATVENEKGNRYVRLAHTIDGKWGENIQIRKLKVIAWMPLPEPYRQHIAEGGENNDI